MIYIHQSVSSLLVVFQHVNDVKHVNRGILSLSEYLPMYL